MPLGSDEHPEMSVTAALLRLDQDTGRIRAQVRRRQRILVHGFQQRFRQRRQLSVPAADRRAREGQTFSAVAALQPMQGHMLEPASHDPVSASRSRSLRTNFGRRVRTTTNEAGRRSTVSATSSPIFSKAASPSCCTSGGKTSISTRGSFSGNGLRPVGLCRVCSRTCSSSAGGAGAVPRACSLKSVASMARDIWPGAVATFSLFCPRMPSSRAGTSRGRGTNLRPRRHQRSQWPRVLPWTAWKSLRWTRA